MNAQIRQEINFFKEWWKRILSGPWMLGFQPWGHFPKQERKMRTESIQCSVHSRIIRPIFNIKHREDTNAILPYDAEIRKHLRKDLCLRSYWPIMIILLSKLSASRNNADTVSKALSSFLYQPINWNRVWSKLTIIVYL